MNLKFINFKLFRNISITFEISKRWNNLNRENYLKFAQNLNKKQLKMFVLKNNRKNLFGPQPNAAHGVLYVLGAPVWQTPAAARSVGPARDGPAAC
jgi:hypothetical protein